eukprot:NODE_5052_length_616_cov_208.156863.p2 GENE.NODE_5052_length_616_cov_208.156863~~NODE_5052_length_616_cov_208.156863.p2  ORF type:complete len:196 (-),score=0.68 NODE_5052_length_616_cov_208.156863:11-598(-)
MGGGGGAASLVPDEGGGGAASLVPDEGGAASLVPDASLVPECRVFLVSTTPGDDEDRGGTASGHECRADNDEDGWGAAGRLGSGVQWGAAGALRWGAAGRFGSGVRWGREDCDVSAVRVHIDIPAGHHAGGALDVVKANRAWVPVSQPRCRARVSANCARGASCVGAGDSSARRVPRRGNVGPNFGTIWARRCSS